MQPENFAPEVQISDLHLLSCFGAIQSVPTGEWHFDAWYHPSQKLQSGNLILFEYLHTIKLFYVFKIHVFANMDKRFSRFLWILPPVPFRQTSDTCGHSTTGEAIHPKTQPIVRTAQVVCALLVIQKARTSRRLGFAKWSIFSYFMDIRIMFW